MVPPPEASWSWPWSWLRLRGGALVEQAGDIKTLALADMARFKQEQLLGDADLAELDAAVALVLQGLHDRTLAAGEAHLQPAAQDIAPHELKADRRRLADLVSLCWYMHRPSHDSVWRGLGGRT